MQRMTIGQVVDFCIEYNNRQKGETVTRKATQADIDAFFGG